jgi:hypothetical protein
MAGLRFAALQSRPMEFLDFTSVSTPAKPDGSGVSFATRWRGQPLKGTRDS